MMREYADVIDLTGNHLEANDLRREADEMVKAVMTLYEHASQRTLAEMRHCYDFATVGRFMAADPSSDCSTRDGRVRPARAAN